MTCGNCVAKVKSELLKLGEVLGAEVQLQEPQATITMAKHLPVSLFQEAISRAGRYRIRETGSGHDMGAESGLTTTEGEQGGNSYYPVFLIFGYIAGATLLAHAAGGAFDVMDWMSDFMAGFFLVFSFFKLLNLKGFAEGYRSYDIVTRSFPVYGFVYPFVELLLGLAFLTRFEPVLTNIVTLLVMGVSTIGVVQSLLKKTPFQCACLGTVIQLPLSKVTLFEDLLMVGMSIVMLSMLAS